jgi:RNA polymerase sigma-70 factor, ECF subfamily
MHDPPLGNAQMNDGDLIQAVQDGDSVSLTVLYQRYVKAVWRYCNAHLPRDKQGAEDLVSETFLAAIRNIRRFDPRHGTVYGWLLGIARNKLRNHWREATSVTPDRTTIDRCVADCRPVGPDQNLLAAETRQSVLHTLDALEDEERLALEWKYMEMLSVRDIAERLGRTEKSVEAILYRARLSFRSAYARRQTQTKQEVEP